MDKLLYTVAETSELLSLRKTEVYELIGNGELESMKIGRARRIPTKAIERFIARQTGIQVYRIRPDFSCNTRELANVRRGGGEGNLGEVVGRWTQEHGDVGVQRCTSGGTSDPSITTPPVFQYLVQRLLDDLLGHFWPTILIVDKSTGVVGMAPHWPKVVKIVRIDLARDFNVSDDAYRGIKTGLETIVPSHVQSAQRIVSKDGGWTYYAKTKSSGLDRIYDKAIESKGLAPSGTIRFETPVIRGRRETLGPNVLADVNDETCIAALRARFKASRWGSDIKVGSGLTQVLERFPIEQSRM